MAPLTLSPSMVVALPVAFLASCYIYPIPGVAGHAFQIEPVSRQYYRTRIFNDGSEHPIEKHADAYNGGGPIVLKERTYERMDKDLLERYGGGEAWPVAVAYDMGEVAPNGNYLESDELAVNHGVCGDTPQSGDDNPIVYSTPNSEWPILEEYDSGSIIDIKVVLTNYHWGHIEFFLCDTADLDDPDGVVTQSCLNKYPLDRADDDSFNSPVDPDYPGRYYIDPQCRGETGETDQNRPEMEGVLNDGFINHMRYKLPDIACERCILQMAYHSGMGCRSHGYIEFEPSSWPSKCAPNKEDWIAVGSHACSTPGRKYGNVFWGCSDIALVGGGSPTPTPPTPTPPTPTPLIPTAPIPSVSGPRYLGCYTDQGNAGRIMHDVLEYDRLTLEMCEAECSSYKFFGTQFGRECWCGGEDTDHLMHGESEACEFECGGDSNQICGGKWSMSVYEY